MLRHVPGLCAGLFLWGFSGGRREGVSVRAGLVVVVVPFALAGFDLPVFNAAGEPVGIVNASVPESGKGCFQRFGFFMLESGVRLVFFGRMWICFRVFL